MKGNEKTNVFMNDFYTKLYLAHIDTHGFLHKKMPSKGALCTSRGLFLCKYLKNIEINAEKGI